MPSRFNFHAIVAVLSQFLSVFPSLLLHGPAFLGYSDLYLPLLSVRLLQNGLA